MEGTNIFIDPEEDEIFFYPVPQELPDPEIKNALLDKIHISTKSDITEKCSDKDNACGSETVTCSKIEESCNNLEKISNASVQSSEATSVISSDVKSKEGCVTSPVETTDQGTNIKLQTEEESIQPQINFEKKKREKSLDMSQNKVNIQIDHNYSTPVKSVIDKNILKTPKSIVKADKDGGFLKVLSEIALVKAEADENTLKDVPKVTDIPFGQELTNDDNKENEQSDNEAHSMNRSVEGSPVKTHQVSLVRKLNCENLRRNSTGSVEALDIMTPENTDISGLPFCDLRENSDSVMSQEENESNNYSHSTTLPLLSDSQYNKTNESNSLKETDECNELHICYEKLNNNIDCNDVIDSQEGADSQLGNSHTLMKSPRGNVNTNSDHDIHVISSKEGDKELFYASDKAPIILINGDAQSEQNLHSKVNLPDDDVKRRLKRNTMRLLQGLNEIVNNEQGKGDASTGLNLKLSEEAAKVIDALKAVGIDDSICSSDQYFDLDKLNNSLLSIDLSNILNDTMSNTLRNEDLEVLLTKLTAGTLECNNHSCSKEPNVEKENLCEIKFDDNLRMVTPQKVLQNHSGESPIVKSTGKVDSVVTSFKSPHLGLKCDYNEKHIGKINSASKKSSLETKPLKQLQNNENGMRGCLSSQKGKTLTKIPKLACTTSKIPVNMRERKMENPVPKSALTKPLIHRAQKNLKFCNIESPVRAYIKSTTPVLVSNVKAKPEPTLGKPWKSCTKVPVKAIAKAEIPKSELKSNIPFTKYRSAIPLKLEKTPDTRTPGLTPKLQKLIGHNSPVIAKHEGRIQLGLATNNAEPSGNDSSVFVNTNEVSVIVRKVAKIPNVK